VPPVALMFCFYGTRLCRNKISSNWTKGIKVLKIDDMTRGETYFVGEKSVLKITPYRKALKRNVYM
jgi:hypothetical protein